MQKICEICKKAPATVHLTDIKNNVTKELHMCENCAASKGININKSIPLESIFADAKAKKCSERQAKIICEKCGMSWAEFRENGRLGCANDYKAFSKGLEPLLTEVHASRGHHTGKSPENTPENRALKEVQELRRKLREAVAREDYEVAAQLRDQISVIPGSYPDEN